MERHIDMKDIIVVSIYDSGYGFNVMVDGVVSSPWTCHEGESIADVLHRIYNEFGWRSGGEFKKMFPDKQIIVCEDGDIEVY